MIIKYLKIKDLNIYNLLASIAVLKELKIDICKIKIKIIKILAHLKEEEKTYYLKI